MAAPYYRPKTLSDALDILASEDVCVAAGCTDLFPATERKTLQGAVLDITAIPDLRGISTNADGSIRIGATTTWADLIHAPLPGCFAGLKQASREVGARQIQNQATLAGNLCNASPAADGVPPLLTLDARVELQSRNGQRNMPLSEFIQAPRDTALRGGEMVTAILIPSTALSGASQFLKLGARDYLVISIAMTAARVVFDGGIVSHAALAIGSCGPTAVRLPEVERLLVGKPLDTSVVTDARVAAAIAPIDDMRADAAYRRRCAATLMRRTLAELAEQVKAAA